MHADTNFSPQILSVLWRSYIALFQFAGRRTACVRVTQTLATEPAFTGEFLFYTIA